MAYDKYELLKTLIRADREFSNGDISGYDDVLVNVVNILTTTHGSEDDLSEAIFEYLAECFTRINPLDAKPATTADTP
jgi:hypothetical protein